MATQLIKGFGMFLLVFVMAFVTAVVSAKGQSARSQRANIPFEFTVGDVNLPAGEYEVRAISNDGDMIRLSAKDSAQGAVRLSNTLTAVDPAESGKLVFHRYGNRYFLSEIWNQGQRDGRQLRMSKAERSIRREFQAVASAKRVYEIVEIAGCPE